jgi:hypothetical protein
MDAASKTKEAWSAPGRRKITPGPARQVDTDFEQHARSYLKTRTRSKGTTGCDEQLDGLCPSGGGGVANTPRPLLIG